jgi:hypothetical protein
MWSEFEHQNMIVSELYPMSGTCVDCPVAFVRNDDICFLERDEREEVKLWFFVLFHILCLFVFVFTLRMVVRCIRQFRYSYMSLDKKSIDMLEDLRMLLNEISSLPVEKRYEQSERYYILTNMLVNKFRIHVYEKILK